MTRHIKQGDTVYLYFAANDTSGSGGDGSSAQSFVRKGGDSAGAAAVISPSPTLLTDSSFTDGCYEIELLCSASAGFSAGSQYAVFASLNIDSQNPTGYIETIVIDPIPANVTEISDDSTAADNAELMFDGTGYAGGTTKLGVDIILISGDATAADNLESYTDGTTPAPVNMTQISGDATAADNLESYCDGTDNQPVDVQEINSVTITGDGSGTPFDV